MHLLRFAKHVCNCLDVVADCNVFCSYNVLMSAWRRAVASTNQATSYSTCQKTSAKTSIARLQRVCNGHSSPFTDVSYACTTNETTSASTDRRRSHGFAS